MPRRERVEFHISMSDATGAFPSTRSRSGREVVRGGQEDDAADVRLVFNQEVDGLLAGSFRAVYQPIYRRITALGPAIRAHARKNLE
jgi:hypothetical protein